MSHNGSFLFGELRWLICVNCRITSIIDAFTGLLRSRNEIGYGFIMSTHLLKYSLAILMIAGVSCSKNDDVSFRTNSSINRIQNQYDHIVMVVLENHAYDQVVGNKDAPFINGLLTNSHTAVFTQSYALTHPSQPNYVMLFSGSNQGIIDDKIPVDTPFTTPNLGAELLQNGYSFSGYSESLPYTGYTGVSFKSYFRTINPWVNWQGNGTNGIPSSLNIPFSQFPTDYTKLPTVSFVIPNLDDDMHNGTIAQGDQWLKTNLELYINWAIDHNSLFILTYDEDDFSRVNQILSFFTGARIKGGKYSQRITHYNVLRTVEDFYHLPYAGVSADSSSLLGIVNSGL